MPSNFVRGNSTKERSPAFTASVLGCQGLPYVRLGNPELPSNPCWRDARLEGRANGIHLTPRQRVFRNVRVSPVGTLSACGQPFHRQVRGMTRRLLRIRPNTRRESPSPFHLLKCCRVEQVQFCIAQVFDGLTQVFWQDVPLRSGFTCRPGARW